MMLIFLVSAHPAEAKKKTYPFSSVDSSGSVMSLSGVSASKLWTTNVSGSLCNRCYSSSWFIDSPMITVQYGVQVILDSTGETVPPGGTIPAGEHVLFLFKPHVSGDIFWFGTGHHNTSPYGDWVTSLALGADGSDSVPQEVGGSIHNICSPENVTTVTHKDGNAAFGALGINAPKKRIGGLDAYTCTPIAATGGGVSSVGTLNGGGLDCVFESGGEVSADFVFEEVSGHFYTNAGPVGGGCYGSNDLSFTGPAYIGDGSRGGVGGGRYTLNVPEQTIPFTLTVLDVGDPPTAPSLQGGAACVVGQPFTIKMSATDPDGDGIRYGVDWNADGAVDQFVPASGYVPSGTEQSSSRTYATSGAKLVKVFAQDEKGKVSPTASINFNCGGEGEEEGDEPSTCPLGYSLQNKTCVFAGCPGGYSNIGGQCVVDAPQCTSSYYCSGNNLFQRNAQCVESFNQTCVFGCTGGGCVSAPPGSGKIIAVPALVRSGEKSVITWDTSDMLSCSVLENNPKIQDSDSRVRGTFISSALTEQTSYTLMCEKEGGGTFSDSATVNILPVFEED
ncbi:MAG: hypothetical protein WA021_03905 [Minisyncoccia bacterium]